MFGYTPEQTGWYPEDDTDEADTILRDAAQDLLDAAENALSTFAFHEDSRTNLERAALDVLRAAILKATEHDHE